MADPTVDADEAEPDEDTQQQARAVQRAQEIDRDAAVGDDHDYEPDYTRQLDDDDGQDGP